MSDDYQSLYEEYFSKYGAPKDPKHLIAYGKKHGRSIKFSIARQLINKNNKNITKNTENIPKQNSKSKAEQTPVTKTKIDSLTNKPAIHKSALNQQFTNGLDSIIQPLATVSVKSVSQKTDLKAMEVPLTDAEQDLKNEIMYKTVKNGTFVKEKGTGSTPKPKAYKSDKLQNGYNSTVTKSSVQKTQNNAFSNNPWLQNDKKKKNKTAKPTRPQSSPPPPNVNPKLKKIRRQLTPIPGSFKFKVKPKKSKPLPMPPDKRVKSVPIMHTHTPQKYWIKPKGVSNNNLARAKPLSDHRKIELKQNALPLDNIKNLSTKDKERDVLQFINRKMGKTLLKEGIKRKFYVSMCENGQILCRILNKISPNIIDKKIISAKPNESKFDKKRINTFIKVLKSEFDIVCQFKCDALLNGKVSVWINIVNTLYVLLLKDAQILREKKEKKAQKKTDMTPLGVWCRINKVSKGILDRLRSNEYDLFKLLTLKSEDIEQLCDNLQIKTAKDKITFIKCIIKLKECSDDRKYIIQSDYICNLETNESFNVQHKSDVRKVLKQLMFDKNETIMPLILSVINNYRNDTEIVTFLLRFISRMNVGQIKIKPESDVRPVLYELRCDESDEYETKLSYHLMEVITEGMTIEGNTEFITENFEKIILNSLCVYLSQSAKGNPFHSRIVCDVLLDKYPLLLYQAILNNKSIGNVLKYACFHCLDHGNFNSFILELLSFETMNNSVSALRKQIISKFIEWKWIDYVLNVCCNNDQFCSNYSLFIIDLLSRCAYDMDRAELFKNKSQKIIHTFISGLLNTKLSKFNRILCAQTLGSIFDIIKVPTLFVDDGSEDNHAMPNNLHTLFESSVCQIYDKYFEGLCDMIVSTNNSAKQMKINNRTIGTPFGLIRLHCLEMIGMSVDLSMLNAAKPLGLIKLQFWEQFLDLLFIHFDNNLFLNQFRRLIHLAMLFRRRILKHLCENCALLDRFIQFYFEHKTHTELHGYIVQMLFNFWSNDQQTQMTTNFSAEVQDNFEIISHFQSCEKWNAFMRVIDGEMKARVITNMEIEETPKILFETEEISIEEETKDSESDSDSDSSFSDSDSEEMNDSKQELGSDELYESESETIHDWNPFRNDILQRNVMPNMEYLSHFGVFKDYAFDAMQMSDTIPKQNENNLFYISYAKAKIDSNAFVVLKYNINKALFKPQAQQSINLMIVLDHSMKMKYRFNKELKSKLESINEIILHIFDNVLSENDRFGLITFNHEAYLEFDLDLKSQYTRTQIEGCIANIRAYGGCDVDGAYYRAIDSYVSLTDSDSDSDDTSQNRILFITSKQPSSRDLFPESLLNLVHRHSNDAQTKVFTTFISVSKQFECNIIDEINECKACNYFHISASPQFMDLSNSFASIMCPIYGNVNVSVIGKDHKSVISNVFGGMMNENERDYRCKTGIIKSFETLFVNSFDFEYNNLNNVILLQLRANITSFKVLMTCQETNGGSQKEMSAVIGFNDSTVQQSSKNSDMKRIVLLTRYVNLLREWIGQWSETNKDMNDRYLSVSDEYKAKFEELSALFEEDSAFLQKELKIMHKLANYDWESAQMIRNLAKYDSNSPNT